MEAGIVWLLRCNLILVNNATPLKLNKGSQNLYWSKRGACENRKGQSAPAE